MNRSFYLVFLALLAASVCFAGCSTPTTASVLPDEPLVVVEAKSGDRARSAVGAVTTPEASRPIAQGPDTRGRETQGPDTQSPGEEEQSEWSDIWNDVSWRRRFAESYFPDTVVEPRLETSEREMMQQIMGAITTEKLDWAENLLQAAIGSGTSAIFEFTLGNVHFQREEFGDAARAYRDAIEKFPKFRRAWKNLGSCYMRENDYLGAVRAFSRVIQNGGVDPITYGALAFCYEKTGRFLDAESAYRMAAMLDPDLLDWKRGLARSLLMQQRFEDAASLLEPVLVENSHLADLWLWQADAYLGMGEVGKAAENFEIVDHLGQSTAKSLNTLGDIYVQQEVFDLAVMAYERALAKAAEPSAATALRNAKILISRRAMDQGKRLLARIEERFGESLADADRKDLLKLRARVAITEQATEEQARILEEIVALDPLDGHALNQLGQYHARKGGVDRAVLYYENAANITEVEANARFYHARLLVGERKYAEALPLLRRSLALEPRDAVQQLLEKVERYAQGGQ